MNCCLFQTKVSEESRLAVTVHQIDEEVSVVPRGAFIKSPHSLVQINRSFSGKHMQYNGLTLSLVSSIQTSYTCALLSGLSHSEAGKLNNFLHFSEPKKKRSILEMGDLNPAIDFLDVLGDDVPKGEATGCRTTLH